MIEIRIVYDDPSICNRIKDAHFKDGYLFDFIDIGSKHGRSKGYKLKGNWGARKNPFVAIYDGDKCIKCFYSEASNDVISDLIQYLK